MKAVDFHEAALRRWARSISELYRAEGRDAFDAELSLLRAATHFLERRCTAADGPLDMYINNLIERAHNRPPDGGTALEYSPGKGGGGGSGGVGGGGGGGLVSEDLAFTFGKVQLSITELCVRHQYCEHVLHKKKTLLDAGDSAGQPFTGVGPDAIASAEKYAQLERLKSGGVEGIEALTQLFI